jgi:putative heme-binding domain-containing protein
MICNRGNEHDLEVVFVEMLKPDIFSKELKLKTLNWLTDAATTRKTKPTGSLDSLSLLLQNDDAQQQLQVVKLASAWELKSAAGSIKQIAMSPTSNALLRKAAIGGLAAMLGPESKSTLLELASKGQPMETRVQSIVALTTVDSSIAAREAANMLADAKGAENLQEMIVAILETKNGADQLARELEGKKLSVDAAKMALRFMYSIGRSDASLSNVLSLAAGVASDPPPPSQEEVAKIAERVITHGNANRGEQIFRRAELSCFKCHSIHRAGGQVGPDLSAIGVSSPVDYVVNSILNPNLAVKEQYVNTIFLMEDGKVLSGVVLDRDDDRVVIRDAQGKTIKLATADIEEEKEGKSQMPQGLTKFLTSDEVVDLARFVSELGKPGPFGPLKSASIQRWQFLKEPPQELTSEVPHLENIRQLVLNASSDRWQSVYGLVSGALPLGEFAVKAEQTVVILQGELQVNEAGSIEFQIACADKFQIWVNDQPFDSKTQFDTRLEVGKHRVILRVEIATHSTGSLKVELSKPGESQVQFEPVGGP